MSGEFNFFEKLLCVVGLLIYIAALLPIMGFFLLIVLVAVN